MYIKIGLIDLKESLCLWRLWTLLGWLEIRQRYARSKLGPFWLTVSMGILVGTMSVVYGALLGQDLSTYLPMLAIGIVVWTLFSTIIRFITIEVYNAITWQLQILKIEWPRA